MDRRTYGLGLLALVSSKFLAGCATEAAVTGAQSTEWKRFSTKFGSLLLEYDLPPGESFSPYPVSEIEPARVTAQRSVAGVSFGVRPQGRALASVHYGVGIGKQKLDGVDPPQSLLNYLKSRANESSRRNGPITFTDIKEVRIGNDEMWVYRKQLASDDRKLAGEDYFRMITSEFFLRISTTVWDSVSTNPVALEQVRTVLRRIVTSVRVSKVP
jgi:hypothetical protein